MTLAWLNLVGLLADFAGFVLLTWDLLPRYLKEREIRELKEAVQSAAAIHVDAVGPDGRPLFVNDQEALTKRVLRFWSRYHWHISDEAEKHPGDVRILAEADVADTILFVTRMIGQRQGDLERFDDQPRPPLVVAVAIIGVGYVLQFIGNWPVPTS